MAFWKSKKSKLNKRPNFEGPNHSSVQHFIQSFCSDYKLWNDYSISIMEDGPDGRKEATRSSLQTDYEHFVGLYTSDLVDLQLISFGTDASFDPARLSFGKQEELPNEIHQTFFIQHTFLDQSDEFVAVVCCPYPTTFQLIQIFYVDPFPDDPLDPRLPYL